MCGDPQRFARVEAAVVARVPPCLGRLPLSMVVPGRAGLRRRSVLGADGAEFVLEGRLFRGVANPIRIESRFGRAERSPGRPCARRGPQRRRSPSHGQRRQRAGGIRRDRRGKRGRRPLRRRRRGVLRPADLRGLYRLRWPLRDRRRRQGLRSHGRPVPGLREHRRDVRRRRVHAAERRQRAPRAAHMRQRRNLQRGMQGRLPPRLHDRGHVPRNVRRRVLVHVHQGDQLLAARRRQERRDVRVERDVRPDVHGHLRRALRIGGGVPRDVPVGRHGHGLRGRDGLGVRRGLLRRPHVSDDAGEPVRSIMSLRGTGSCNLPSRPCRSG